MIKSTLVLSLLLSTAAMAQTRGSDIGSEAQRLASEIQRESRYLNRDQASQIRSKFEEIRDILYRTGGGGGGAFSYSCISRDNDNSRPYVYALRDGINMIRVSAMQFQSMDACQASISSIKYVGGAAIACVSRDNDDARPWVFATLNGQTVNKLSQTSTQSLADCKGLMDRMIVLPGSSVAYCKARDNDNARPYVAATLDLQSGTFKQGSENFSDLESCWRFLGN